MRRSTLATGGGAVGSAMIADAMVLIHTGWAWTLMARRTDALYNIITSPIKRSGLSVVHDRK